ncbi:WD40-repeat-containing domain protein [Trichoderma camerunense]
MDNSRNISGNTLGDNAMLNQGNFNITVNAASSDDKRKFLRNKRIQTLKDHKNFDRWRRGSSGIFWIKGDPGKGKTMLLCGIIDEFEKDPTLSPSLSYFFCQATDSRINTPTAVRNEAILSQILATYEDQLEGPNAWFVLCEIFEAIIQNPPFEESIFVVDGLDECMKDNSSLLRFIVRTSGRVRWLISSRNEKDIERELRSIQPPQILSLDHAEFISSSIEIYINSRIAEIEALKDDEELRIKTQKILKDKAADTFLWVALVIEQLRNAAHWQVEDVLQEVPEGLESLYALILDKASLNQSSSRWRKKGQDACQLLVSIVTTAERPLHLEELYTFMSYQWEHFKSTVNLHDLESITKDCGSIFSIRNDAVYFIHQSAKDYILKEKFPLGLRSQHLRMFQTSTEAMSKFLKYDIYDLKTPGIHINEIQPQIPDPMAPIKYCCVFWAHHLFSCYPLAAESEQNADIITILIKFLKKTFLCWVESLALMRRLPHALDIFQKLNDLSECTVGKCGHEHHISQQELHLFIQDGYQFLIRSRETVENWPLQLYFSATAFERANSAIRDAFEETVHKHWGPSPIVLNVSQDQSSVLLRTFTNKFTQEEDVELRALLFSPDSSLLYSLHSKYLAATRVDTGVLHSEIEVGEGAQLAIAPNSNSIILVRQSGKVEVWNMEDQRCVQEYALNLKEDKPINDVIAISSNGDLIASFHAESNVQNATGQVKIWQTRMVVCDCLWDQPGRPEAAFSPNSELLALADQAGIRIHCTHTGSLIKYLKAHWWDDETWVNWRLKRCSIFSPDSRYFIAVGDARYPWLWSTKTWKCKPLHRIEEPVIRNISISPDSSFLGICSHDTLRLWMIETGECISKVAGPSSFMAFSPNWTKSMLVASQLDNGAVQIRRVDVSHDQMKDLLRQCIPRILISVSGVEPPAIDCVCLGTLTEVLVVVQLFRLTLSF